MALNLAISYQTLLTLSGRCSQTILHTFPYIKQYWHFQRVTVKQQGRGPKTKNNRNHFLFFRSRFVFTFLYRSFQVRLKKITPPKRPIPPKILIWPKSLLYKPPEKWLNPRLPYSPSPRKVINHFIISQRNIENCLHTTPKKCMKLCLQYFKERLWKPLTELFSSYRKYAAHFMEVLLSGLGEPGGGLFQ